MLLVLVYGSCITSINSSQGFFSLNGYSRPICLVVGISIKIAIRDKRCSCSYALFSTEILTYRKYVHHLNFIDLALFSQIKMAMSYSVTVLCTWHCYIRAVLLLASVTVYIILSVSHSLHDDCSQQ